MIYNKIVRAGKRKRAIAKAVIIEGNGKILINKKPYEQLDFFKKIYIQELVEISKKVLGHFNFEIKVICKGGGQEGQIAAARLAIARVLIDYTKSNELKKAYIRYDKGLLIADTRRKEAYKPGDSKARRKRQKSFR